MPSPSKREQMLEAIRANQRKRQPAPEPPPTPAAEAVPPDAPAHPSPPSTVSETAAPPAAPPPRPRPTPGPSPSGPCGPKGNPQKPRKGGNGKQKTHGGDKARAGKSPPPPLPKKPTDRKHRRLPHNSEIRLRWDGVRKRWIGFMLIPREGWVDPETPVDPLAFCHDTSSVMCLLVELDKKYRYHERGINTEIPRQTSDANAAHPAVDPCPPTPSASAPPFSDASSLCPPT